jgi:hypothetical protein
MVEETEDSLPKKRALYTINSIISAKYLLEFVSLQPCPVRSGRILTAELPSAALIPY